jgi:tetratricopeptide (TPR) repeat protein
MRTSYVAITVLALATVGYAGLRGKEYVGLAFAQEQSGVIPFLALENTPLVKAEAGLGKASVPEQNSAAASDRRDVDESALRYFAAQGDIERLNKEIARLKVLYPNWVPPKDPLDYSSSGDRRIENLWKLYSEGLHEEVDSEIARIREDDPAFIVPAELLSSLKLAKDRQEIVMASEDGRFQTVIDISARATQLLTCAEVDVMWRLAEAFAETGRQQRAVDAYRYILENCDNPAERMATPVKAAAFLDVAQMQSLLELERRDKDGKGEFDDIRDDLARSIVSRAADDKTITVPNEYLTQLKRTALRKEEPSDAIILGWYSYERALYTEAQSWFRNALEQVKSPEAAQGLALSEIELGNFSSAEDLLYEFRNVDEETGKVYLAAVSNLLGLNPPKAITAEVLLRMAPVVLEARSVVAVEQFGWYAHYLGQHTTATEWFRTALSWDPAHEPAAYGLALALTALGQTGEVSTIQNAWKSRSARIANLGDDEDARTSARPAAPKTTTTAPARAKTRSSTRSSSSSSARSSSQNNSCKRTQSSRNLSPESALTRGWCLMELDRTMEAVHAFERALESGSDSTRREAAYGQSLAYLRLEMPDKAAAAATGAPQSPERAKELQSAILADRAIGAFKIGRYHETIIALDQRARFAPERQDLMIIRGYAYQKLGRRPDAIRVFRSLVSVGNKDAMRALADLTRQN